MQIKTKIVSCRRADSKPVKQEVNGTVILPPFSIPWFEQKLKFRVQNLMVTQNWVQKVLYDGWNGGNEGRSDERCEQVRHRP